MKHEQVTVDYWTMVKTSCLFLLLALSGYVLIKMVQTIFWLPNYLQNNQKRLEELAAQYSVDLNKEQEKLENIDEDTPLLYKMSTEETAETAETIVKTITEESKESASVATEAKKEL